MGTGWSQDDEAAATASQLQQPTHQSSADRGQLPRQHSVQKQSEEKQSQGRQSENKSNTAERVGDGKFQEARNRTPAATQATQPITGGGQLQRQYSQKQSQGNQSEAKQSENISNMVERSGDGKLGEAKNRASASTQVKLPHNWEAILREADTPIERSSPDRQCNQLFSGVFLNKKSKKYWVDRNSNINCFTLFARDLLITWADDPRYWHWPSVTETRDVTVEAAELLAVCWLEVHGNFDTTKLSPGTLYEVIFVIMLKDPAAGWEVPVNFRLTLPNRVKQEHKENLMTKPRLQWIEIPVGEFRTSPENIGGNMEISMFEYEGGTWKKGLILKGVTIRPKSSTT